MKTHLSVFAISAILIVSIGMTPTFGQIQDSIVVTTDKASYFEGETIVITGEVKDLYSGVPVSLMVKNDLAIVALDQLTVGADKIFSTEIIAGGTMNKIGTYTILVTYGTENRTAETSFEFSGVSEVSEKPIVGQVTSTITDTTVSVQGSVDLIRYEITGGKLLGVEIDRDRDGNNIPTLMIYIDATSDGSLTLTIPRSVLDSFDANGVEDEFFVLIDGEEVEFEETTSPTDRTLTIPFYAGSELIEILGSVVIPEFGTIAAMILAVAIISIIAISAKSRLSIIPRY